MTTAPTIADVLNAKLARIEAIKYQKLMLLPQLDQAFDTGKGKEYIALESRYSKLCHEFEKANREVCDTVATVILRNPDVFNVPA